jgi:thioesterase domain-containing protein
VVARLVLLDAQPSLDSSVTLPDQGLSEEHLLEQVSRMSGIDIGDAPTSEQLERLLRAQGAVEFLRYKQLLGLLVQNLNTNIGLYHAHEAGVLDGDVVIFSAVRDQSDRSSFLLRSWRPYATGSITVYPIDCTHNEMLTAESARRYDKQLNDALALDNVYLSRFESTGMA